MKPNIREKTCVSLPTFGARLIARWLEVVGLAAVITTTCVTAAGAVLIDLGTLGGMESRAYGINEAGEVLGSAQTPGGDYHAFKVSSGVMNDLGTLGGPHSGAADINEFGDVVGAAQTVSGASHAYLHSGGVMTDLGTFGGSESVASAMNDAGQIAGYALTAGGERHLFFYSGGVMTDLGVGGYPLSDINEVGEIASTGGSGPYFHSPLLYSGGVVTDLGLPANMVDSWAVAINDAGQVLINAVDLGAITHSWDCVRAYVWSGGVLHDLGLPAGRNLGCAAAMNEAGQIVGRSYNTGSGGDPRAFLYNDGVMTDLGTLGGAWSRAHDINELGQVVGISATASGEQHAFFYSGGVMADLGTLGGAESWATAVNDAGQVVGYSQTALGETHAFLGSTACGEGVVDTVEVLPPLQIGVENLVQKGQVVPVKVRVLCDGQAELGLTPAIQLFNGNKTGLPDSAPDVLVTESVSYADTTGVMRADGSKYAYNLRVPSSSNSGALVKGDELTIRIRPFAPGHTTANVTDIVLEIRK